MFGRRRKSLKERLRHRLVTFLLSTKCNHPVDKRGLGVVEFDDSKLDDLIEWIVRELK